MRVLVGNMGQLAAMSALKTGAEAAASQLVGAGPAGMAAATAAAGAPGAVSALSFVASTVAQEGVANKLDDAESSLRELANKHDDPDTRREAIVGKVASGLSQCISPAVTEDQELSSLATSDPEQFQQLVTQLLEDPERRSELETIEATLQALFTGEEPPAESPIDDDMSPDAVIDTLVDVFDAADRQEAMSLFVFYEELLSSFESTLNDHGHEDAAGAASDQRDAVREWSERAFDAYLQANVRNQGFDILTTRDFEDREPFPNETKPITAWVTGYSWPALVATDDAGHHYHFKRELPEGHPLGVASDQDDSELVESVLHYLDERGNLVLKGGPGMGKTHICRRVAATWFTEGRGEVFYRESGDSQPFEKTGELIQAIERSQGIGDGTVLVVVEDASRTEARLVFDVLEEFRGREEDVRFLFDTRVSDWEEFVAQTDRPYIEAETELGGPTGSVAAKSPPGGVGSSDDTPTLGGHESDTIDQSGSLMDDISAGTGSRASTTETVDSELGSVAPGTGTAFDTSGGDGTSPGEPGSLGTGVSENMSEAGFDRTLYVHPIPSVSKADCGNALETFNNALEDGWYDGSAETLHNAVTDDRSDRGELLVLANELVANSTYFGPLPLGRAAGAVHSGTDMEDGYVDAVQTSSEESPLFYQLAVGIALLTAAELELQPALLYALADNDTQRREIEGLLDDRTRLGDTEIPVALKGVFVFPDDTTADPYTGRHALWGQAFLEDLITKRDDGFWSVEDPLATTLQAVITGMVSLATDRQKQEATEQYFRHRLGRPATPYLDRVDDEPRETLNELLEQLFEFGTREPELFPVFEVIIDGLPEEGSETARLRFRLQIAQMVGKLQRSGSHHPRDGETASDRLASVRADADRLASPDRERIRAVADRELAKRADGPEQTLDRLRRASDELTAVSQPRLEAKIHEDLGKHAYGWSEKRRHYEHAIDAYEQVDGEAAAELRRTLAQQAPFDADWSEVRSLYKDTIDAFSQFDQREAAKTRRDFAQTAETHSAVPWDKVRELYDDAISHAEDIDVELQAEFTYNLARAATKNRSVPTTVADRLYDRAVGMLEGTNERAAAEARRQHASATDYDTDWSTTRNRYEAALELAADVDPELVADIREEMARNARWEESIPWTEVRTLFNEAIEAYEPVDRRAAVRLRGRLADAAAERAGWEAGRTQFEDAIKAAEGFTKRTAAKLAADLARTASHNDDSEWSETADLYTDAIERYQAVNDHDRVVTLQMALADEAVESAGWQHAQQLYQQAIETAATISSEDVARVYESRARTALDTQTVPWTTKVAAVDEAIEQLEGVSSRRQASLYDSLASQAGRTPTVPWKEVKKLHERAAQMHSGVDRAAEARVRKRLAFNANTDEDVQWHTVKKLYNDAIDAHEKANEPTKAIEAQHELADAAAESDAVGWSTTKELFNESMEQAESGAERTHVRVAAAYARAASQADGLDWNTIKNRYDVAIDAAKNTNTDEYLRLLERRASAAASHGTVDWDQTESLYEDAITEAQRLDRAEQVRFIESLATEAQQTEQVDWSTVSGYLDRAVDAADEYERGVDTRVERARAASRSDAVEWTTAKRLFEETIKIAKNREGEDPVQVRQRFAATAQEIDAVGWRQTKRLYKKIITNERTSQRNIQQATLDLAEAAAEAATVDWATTRQHYKQALEAAEEAGPFAVANVRTKLASAASASATPEWSVVRDLHHEATEACDSNNSYTRAVEIQGELVQAARQNEDADWAAYESAGDRLFDMLARRVDLISHHNVETLTQVVTETISHALERGEEATARRWSEQFEEQFVEPREDMNTPLEDIRRQLSE